jgi:hypothetical protein
LVKLSIFHSPITPSRKSGSLPIRSQTHDKPRWTEVFAALVDEDDVRSLFVREFAAPEDIKEILRLANDWWEFAETQSGAVKLQATELAAIRYASIVKQLKGFEQKQVETRLAGVIRDHTVAVRVPAPVTEGKPEATNIGGDGDWGFNYFVVDAHEAPRASSTTLLDNVVVTDLRTKKRVYNNSFNKPDLKGWKTYAVSNSSRTVTPVAPAYARSGHAVLTKGRAPYETVCLQLEQKLPKDFEISFDLRHEGSGHSHIKFLRSPYPRSGISITTPPAGNERTLLAFYSKIEGLQAVWADLPLHGLDLWKKVPFATLARTGERFEFLSYRIRKQGSQLIMWVNGNEVARTEKLIRLTDVKPEAPQPPE